MNNFLTREEELVKSCIDAGLSLAVAESCSGGLIAHRITNVPGASAVFQGGIVAYANSAKTSLLGVPEALIDRDGAVSESVAVAMAQGALAALSSDLAGAVTGIAGPGGGSPDKPVGTVCVAAASRDRVAVKREHFTGDRETIKMKTADSALALMLKLLETP